MELVSSVRRFIFKVIFVILYCLIILWFAIFLYGVIYFLYIPAVAHVHPIYLQYDAACRGKMCKHPTANVSLVQPGYHYLLTGGQNYAIEVLLEMPESEVNRLQGMFMIKLSMASQTGDILQTSSRPAVLHYRSPLFRTIYTIFFSPAFLAGTFEEKQNLVVSLFENYVEDSYRPTYFAIIEIQARFAEVYSCSLQIHAQFTGLRYYMYYWPLSLACVIIAIIFILLCILTLCMWMRYVVYSPTDEISETKRKPKKTSLSSPSKHVSSRPANITKSLVKLSDVDEQQNLQPEGEESGIEVLLTEKEILDLQQMPEPDEIELDLAVGLRKRNR